MIHSFISKRSGPAIVLIISVLFAVSALYSCAGVKETSEEKPVVSIYEKPIDFAGEGYTAYLSTMPEGGKPVFFAAVQRMADRGKETDAALRKAADQASKYSSVRAVSRLYTVKLNSSSRHLSDLDVDWDTDLSTRFIKNLTITGISQDTYGTYLRAVLSDTAAPQVSGGWKLSSDGEPGWIKNTPDFPGYLSAVGMALQTGYIADSFDAADNQALEALARQISVSIVTDKRTIQNSVGSASIQSNYEESEVAISGFYIVERWRSPDARYYYSLAVAPVAKR